MNIVVIGGGAAGYFGALRARELNRKARVLILESAAQPLGKVRISGGGRCNVTTSCFEVSRLVKSYPRGERELRGVFARFGPRDTVAWFESHGVRLKTEPDGRMFPVTDRSETIVDCLTQTAERLGVEVRVRSAVTELTRTRHGFGVSTTTDRLEADRVLLAPGSSRRACDWVTALGHRLVAPVPSLFTFNVSDPRLKGLEGIALPTRCTLDGGVSSEGPLLITHWGVSGPAVLRLSAWGARLLHDAGYRATLRVDLLPDLGQEEVRTRLFESKSQLGRRKMATECPFDLPRRLWARLAEAERPWCEVANKTLNQLTETLKRMTLQIEGKGVFKEEFVTAGGVPLSEVDLTTFESRVAPGLYLAGEILDVDGVTGGFNFQSAWSTSWLAGSAISR